MSWIRMSASWGDPSARDAGGTGQPSCPRLTRSAVEERQRLRPVELRAGDGWQVENVGDQVGEVAVTDRLLPAIAGPGGTRTAEGGVHRVEIAPGGHPGTPGHEGDAVVLQT